MGVNSFQAAIKAEDKAAAKGFVDCAKQFDEAIAALEQVSVNEIDLNEIPPTPPPYRCFFKNFCRNF